MEPAPKFCPICGAPLKTLRTRRRTVHTLTSTIEVTLVEKTCGDTGCALGGVTLKPPLPLALPYLHYGVDVTLHAATERERGVPASRVFDRRPSPSTVIRHTDRLALLGEASARLDREAEGQPHRPRGRGERQGKPANGHRRQDGHSPPRRGPRRAELRGPEAPHREA